ncbi:MAG: PP2C family protein-serine/threonine phosphatase [Actinoplanes sp.]
MDHSTELRWLRVLSEVLTSSHLTQADELAPTIDAALARLGMGATIFLVDHEQVMLRALPVPGRLTPEPVPVDGTLPGRVFTLVQTEPADAVWTPLLDGTERFGVVRFSLPGDADPGDPDWHARCEMLAGLAGHLIATKLAHGDILHVTRRSQPMTTAAELMWKVMPPLTSSHERLAVSAILQPCYDIGGDGFDYAIDGDHAQLIIWDAMGRGLSAALAGSVAVSAIRAARRAGAGLEAQARAADDDLAEQFGPTGQVRFVTALLIDVDLETGRLRYLNAGHPPALLLRDRRLIGQLGGGRRMPLGVADNADDGVAEDVLQPGDRLLLHTDGVTEARAHDGTRFGLERLLALAEEGEQAGLPAPETLRRLALAIAAHQDGPPKDDATLMLMHWSRAAAMRTVTVPPVPAIPSEGDNPP